MVPDPARGTATSLRPRWRQSRPGDIGSLGFAGGEILERGRSSENRGGRRFWAPPRAGYHPGTTAVSARALLILPRRSLRRGSAACRSGPLAALNLESPARKAACTAPKNACAGSGMLASVGGACAEAAIAIRFAASLAPRYPGPCVPCPGCASIRLSRHHTQLGQLARDAPATPQRVLARHAFDQCNNLHVEGWRAVTSRFPRPEARESATMPSDDHGGLNDHQRVRPARPSSRQNGPEGSVDRSQPRSWRSPVQDRELLPERKILKHQLALERNAATSAPTITFTSVTIAPELGVRCHTGHRRIAAGFAVPWTVRPTTRIGGETLFSPPQGRSRRGDGESLT